MLHLIPSHQGRPADDPIFALNREAVQRKQRGEHVVNATVGALLDDEGKLSILPSAVQAIRDVPAEEWAAYAPIAGTPDFLGATMDDLLGGETDFRSIAVASATPGGSGALRHALANYLEPGQALLTTNFFWGPYQTLADEADRRVETFAMFDANGGLDVQALDRALAKQMQEQKRVLLFLNDPCHNPTGYSMLPGEWSAVAERLLAYADQGPVTLLVDCAYYAYGAADPRAFLKQLRPLLGRIPVLFAWSASKSFTHYGLRVGSLIACIADPKERALTAAAFSYSSRGTWSNCNRGGLFAITKLLLDPSLSAACNKEREALKAQLRRRVEAFNNLARGQGLNYPRYDGGFFVTVFHAQAAAHAERMRTRGVFVVPQNGALRVALCGVAERDVPTLVSALADGA